MLGVSGRNCPPDAGANASVGAWMVAGIAAVGAGLDGADMWQPHVDFAQQRCVCGRQQVSTGPGRLALNRNVSSAVKTVTTVFIGVKRRLALGRCQDSGAVLRMMHMRWYHILLMMVAITSRGEDHLIHLAAKPAPVFTLKDLDNVEVASTNFAGTTRLVFFWASWDKPCQQQLDTLIEIQKAYGPSNLTVLGLALDWQNPAGLKTFLSTNSVNFPVFLADYNVIKDFGGVDAIPTLYIVEPHGIILNRFVGLTDKAVITNFIEAIKRSTR
jgi:thiol-disulfide isomerase/thioredoxin